MSFVTGHPVNLAGIDILYDYADKNRKVFEYIRQRGNECIYIEQIKNEIIADSEMNDQYTGFLKIIYYFYNVNSIGEFILMMRVCDYITKGIKT